MVKNLFYRYKVSSRYKVVNEYGEMRCAVCDKTKGIRLYKRKRLRRASDTDYLKDVIMLCSHCRNMIFKEFKETQNWKDAINQAIDIENENRLELKGYMQWLAHEEAKKHENDVNIYKGKRVLETISS